MCGEQSDRDNCSDRDYGSSPRVRGTGNSQAMRDLVSRFIPACAGNRSARFLDFVAVAVHPRVCGEQIAGNFRFKAFGGSSPRVRGTAQASQESLKIGRFIPACAGNRIRWIRRSIRISVHPRVCGEQYVKEITMLEYRGSSPRVRGTEPVAVRPIRLIRFIPACAGNSSTAPCSIRVCPVHPRVCGEQKL